jgi:outer membrane protein TolC
MRRPCLVLCAALAVTGAPARTAAARKIDRQAAIQIAVSQNPQIAAARADEAAVRAQQRQAHAAYMPMLSLTTGVGTSDKATLVPGTAVESVEQQYKNVHFSDLRPVWLGNLSVIQPLYTFGKIARRNEAAAHGLRAREAETRMKKADVAFEVAQLYEGALYARDARRFFEEMKSWLEKVLQGTEDMVARKVGKANERDILRVQAGLGLAEMGINEARAGENEARAGLAAYLGIPADEPLELADDELVPIGRVPAESELAGLVHLASDNRPEFTATREGQRAFDALARAERAGLWPNIFIMAFVDVALTPDRDWIETRFVIDPLNHVAPGALLGLRWELQGAMAPARAAEQHAHADALLNLGRWAADGVPAEVRKAYEDLVRAQKDIEAGTVAVKRSKQWMVEASSDYSVGLLDIRELSDAASSYVTLRTALLRARFDHNCALAALAKATGMLDGNADPFYPAPVDAHGSASSGGTP